MACEAIVGATLPVSEVGREGAERTYAADAAERALIAEMIGVERVDALDATLLFMPWGRGGVRARGEIRASISQLCVVTLEPVESDVEVLLDERFLPREAFAQTAEIDIDDPADAEPFEGGRIDVARLIVDFLVTGINPYPRVRDAQVEVSGDWAGGAESEDEEGVSSPFAGLAALHQREDE